MDSDLDQKQSPNQVHQEDYLNDPNVFPLISPTPGELEEHQHFFDIINTFKYYKYAGFKKIEQSLNYINEMPQCQQVKLADYVEHLLRLRTCFSHNHAVIQKIIETANMEFNNFKAGLDNPECLVLKQFNQLDTDRVHSVLTQLVREWTLNGSDERQTSFGKIVATIDKYFGDQEEKFNVKILVPGAALGRLPYEIASRGYSCEGNEFSMMMLIVSNFILNQIEEANMLHLYPWVSHYANNMLNQSQTEIVSFPDINIEPVDENVQFSMVGGSFLDVYKNIKNRETRDCVATSFFIDTAPNVIDYIETIWCVLKPGGYWINFGPLLYHYADMSEPSIEPSYEILRNIIESYGFIFLEEETGVPCYYTRNVHSMLCYKYNCIYFLCRKPFA